MFELTIRPNRFGRRGTVVIALQITEQRDNDPFIAEAIRLAAHGAMARTANSQDEPSHGFKKEEAAAIAAAAP